MPLRIPMPDCLSFFLMVGNKTAELAAHIASSVTDPSAWTRFILDRFIFFNPFREYLALLILQTADHKLPLKFRPVFSLTEAEFFLSVPLLSVP